MHPAACSRTCSAGGEENPFTGATVISLTRDSIMGLMDGVDQQQNWGNNTLHPVSSCLVVDQLFSFDLSVPFSLSGSLSCGKLDARQQFRG